MKLSNDKIEKLLESLVEREQQERLALASDASEVLSRLNISIEKLPQKCQQLLHEVCATQASSDVEQLDAVSLSLCPAREIADQLDDEYEILKLNQKNKELQAKIVRNAKVIEQLKRDLGQSRLSLNKQTPSAENVQDYCRQIRQKVASYEDSCQRAQAKFSSLSVPAHAMPSSLVSLATSLGQLCEEATSLRQRAEDVQLAHQARHTLKQLRK